MNKLEEKLEELGYTQDSKYVYTKNLNKCYILIIIYKNRISRCGISSIDFIEDNEDINNLKQALKQMQQELKVLKQCQY